jgi:uncharacterized protein (TIGR03437 family)
MYGRFATRFQVEVSGSRSDPLYLNIGDTTPGVFTLNRLGTGQGSVVNQDGTDNSPSSPAARDSVITIYGTGEGQTKPPGQDGRIIDVDLRNPLAPVLVKIGGVPMQVQYAGSAAGQVSGYLRINVYVPPDAPTGIQVPVEVQIGGVTSQLGVSIAIQ